MKYCTRCLMPSARPRITFNEQGVCNACLWTEAKKQIEWKLRYERLREICDVFRRNSYFDVLVPCSGGKDGSYVAWKLKHELKMTPLCITFSSPLQTEIGRTNLENFRNSGFDLIELRPNPKVYAKLCRNMFVEHARCKFPFVIAIGTAIIKEANMRGIPLIMFGEEGESEYGGSDQYAKMEFMTHDFLINVYHEGHQLTKYLDEFKPNEILWWLPPSEDDLRGLKVTWWSKWEDWDPEAHARLASEKTGLQMLTGGVIGSFTNYSQLDDDLQDLHMFEAFIKFGFGRATADCSIEIRRGRMSRETAIKIANEVDGQFPFELLDKYLDFLQMSESEFWKIIDKHVNREILIETGMKHKPYQLRELIH